MKFTNSHFRFIIIVDLAASQVLLQQPKNAWVHDAEVLSETTSTTFVTGVLCEVTLSY
jgi:hypothetical protein